MDSNRQISEIGIDLPRLIRLDATSGDLATDRLGRETFVHILQHLLDFDRLGPGYVLGISGGWGTGKTWVLKSLKSNLENNPVLRKTKAIWFDAWKYENSDGLLYSLVKQIESEADLITLGRRKVYFDGLATAILDGIDSVSGPLAKAHPYLAATPLGSKILRRLADKKFDAQKRMAEKFCEIIKLIATDSGRVVIFIDDLDRCLPESIIGLLEQIKHITSYPNCAAGFVLGIDREAIRSAVRSRYGPDFSQNATDSYVEKIVNHCVELPEPRVEHYEALLSESFERFAMVVDPDKLKKIAVLLKAGRLNNARKILLALNSLDLISRAYEEIQDFPLVEVFGVLLLKEFWPELYRDLLRDKELFGGLQALATTLPGHRLNAARNNARPPVIEEKYISDEDLFHFLAALVPNVIPINTSYSGDAFGRYIRYAQLVEPFPDS
jgi:hypothetical protein